LRSGLMRQAGGSGRSRSRTRRRSPLRSPATGAATMRAAVAHAATTTIVGPERVARLICADVQPQSSGLRRTRAAASNWRQARRVMMVLPYRRNRRATGRRSWPVSVRQAAHTPAVFRQAQRMRIGRVEAAQTWRTIRRASAGWRAGMRTRQFQGGSPRCHIYGVGSWLSRGNEVGVG
jgi:hypothetical protein